MKLSNPFKKEPEKITIFEIKSDGKKWDWKIHTKISAFELIKILNISENEIMQTLENKK